MEQPEKHDRQGRQDEAPPPLTEAPKFLRLQKMFGPGEASLLAQASSVGIAFAVSIVLGLASGWWLDQKLGTSPWLLLLCLLLGIAGGFRNLFVVSARIDRKSREAAANKNIIRDKKDGGGNGASR
ncbi:MAG: AtpZ/AtpI family protein [Candidatus Adiutrix sp.]|jgi:ATP synthase protein I|nr:AtpZ/AtpI family protein [Candidatus Adiutrix sp.]